MIKKIFLIIFSIGMFSLAGYVEHNYIMEGIVIDENTIEDATGNIWEMDYISYRNGSIVKIHFNDNCTTGTREDDTITKIILKKH